MGAVEAAAAAGVPVAAAAALVVGAEALFVVAATPQMSLMPVAATGTAAEVEVLEKLGNPFHFLALVVPSQVVASVTLD